MSLDLAGLAPALIDLGVLPSELDEGIASRAAIGLVVLATDQTMEHEFRALLRLPGVAVYQSRVFNDAEIRPDTLRAIGPRIAPSVALILPGIPLDVVAFGCTSATMTLGEEAVFAEIRKERPNVACTTPVTAALAAFRALSARSIGLLTPYAPEINASLVAYLRSRGVEVAAAATFDRRDDRDAARISVASIEAGIRRLAAAPGVETIFVSCTSLRVAESVAKLERLAGEARELLDSIDTSTVVGLRDRALISVMTFAFARIGAAVAMRVEDYYPKGKRWWVRLHEKGGKRHEMPAHHNLEAYLDAYIKAAGIGDDGKAPLFRSAAGRTGALTEKPMNRVDAWRMVQRRAADLGARVRIGCHTFRATGITAYLEAGGTLENAQLMAAHESPRTTKLYDRTGDEITLDEVERIAI